MEQPCLHCGELFDRKAPGQKYCSKTCRPVCEREGCDRPQKSQGLCNSHFSGKHRAANPKLLTCSWCGETKEAHPSATEYCSRICQQMAANKGRVEQQKAAPPTLRQCKRCGRSYAGNNTYCSDECRKANALDQARVRRSALRIAVEANDYSTILTEIRKHVLVDDNDCWVWQGKLNDGYPVRRIDGKTVSVHRLSLEAKYGAPLGSQAAHHVCANPSCVNPDHLQPVTHRENIAEMLARQSYLARIRELEAALGEVSPGHELLHRVAVA